MGPGNVTHITRMMVDRVRGRHDSPATILTRSAQRWPERPGVIDDERSLTLAELHEQVRELAGALHARGIRHGSTVGLLCHHHAGLAEAALATLWVGAVPRLLQPDIDHVQLAELTRRSAPDMLVHDAVLLGVVRRADLGITTLVSDAHGSGSVTGARSFGHPAPRTGRAGHASLEGSVLASALAEIGAGRPVVLSRASRADGAAGRPGRP